MSDDDDKLEKKAAERYKRLMQRKVDIANKRAASIAKDFLMHGDVTSGPDAARVRGEVLAVFGQKPPDRAIKSDPDVGAKKSE